MTGLWRAAPAAAILGVLAVPLVALDSSRPAPADQAVPPDGKMLYLRDCASCHDEAGQGTPRGQSLQNIGPAEAHYAITTGRMPIAEPGAERQRRPVEYRPQEVEALVDHMRSFLASEPDIPNVDVASGDLSKGGELYLAQCAACHQWAGKGGALMGQEAPALDQSTPTQIAEAIRSGPVAMPKYGEEVLSDHEVNSIVKYVLYLREPEDRGGAGLWHYGPFTEGLVAWVVGMGVLLLAVLWIGERGTGEHP
jgi:ubiquinol-cytochrome c reductase cytochrome c subunit